ncbi:MAG TPA: hypothetical protein VGE74_17885 [Gemmata sp.]
MAIIVTTPWSDYRFGNKAAALAKEVSGVTSGKAALAATGLDVGSEHPEDSTYTVDSYDVTQLSIGFYRVTFSFSNENGEDGGGGPGISQPPRIKWTPVLVSEAFDRDVDGNAIVNAARDPYDPPPPADAIELELSITRVEPMPFDPQKSLKYMRRVNQADFTVQGHRVLEGQCRCEFIGPANEYTMKANRGEVAYLFRLRKDGFDIRLPNVGYRAGQPVPAARGGMGDPVPLEIFGYDRQQITQPVRLDGLGRPLDTKLVDRYGFAFAGFSGPPPGATVEESLDGNGKVMATFLRYKRNQRANFNELGL